MATVKRTYGRRREPTPTSDVEDDTPPTSQHSQGLPNTLESKAAFLGTRLDPDSESDSDEDIALPSGDDKHRPSSSHVGAFTFDDEEEEEEADDYGNSRVQPSLSVSQIMQDDDSDAEEEQESAYDRVRRELLAAKAPIQKEAFVKALPKQSTSSDSTYRHTSASLLLNGSKTMEEPGRHLEDTSRSNTPFREQEQVHLPRSPLLKTASEEETFREVQAKILDSAQTSGSDSEDIEAAIRLSSSKRVPRRHASKKAIEEMHRETERIQRTMTLAPNAQVKTKLKMSDFLSKIGFQKSAEVATTSSATSGESVSITAKVDQSNVLMSMPSATQVNLQDVLQEPLPITCPIAEVSDDSSDEDIGLPGVSAILSSQPTTTAAPTLTRHDPNQNIRIHEDVLLDSDSDSDNFPSHLKSHKLLFKKRNFEQIKRDRRAAKFVAMARPDSPTKIEARAEKLRKAELLAQVARQAKADRQAREAAMKASGVNVVSTKQRQKEALEIEDLVDRARKQADELRRLERSEDKKKKAEAEGLEDDSATDEDWQAEALVNSDSDIGTDLDEESNSSDHDQSDQSEADDSLDIQLKSKPEHTHTESIPLERQLRDEEDLDQAPRRHPARNPRKARILDDEESSSDADKENSLPTRQQDDLGAGLTQFFEPTQASSASGSSKLEFSATQFLEMDTDVNHESMQRLRASDSLLDSQATGSRAFQGPRVRALSEIDFSQHHIRSSQPEHDTEFNATQFSVFDPPSPDEPVVPLQLAFSTQFTQATEVDSLFVSELAAEVPAQSIDMDEFSSSAKPRLNRLRKANNLDQESDESSFNIEHVNPFRRKREVMNEEHRKRSRKALVDDRAVESDDEYAGLGGASDEEPEDTAEASAEVAGLIDHEIVDEDEEGQRRIAAFYAQKDLENDEKMINSLMNDINNGGLRRKRGAGLLDMDDSDDEEAEGARYRARQAQMRARLLDAQNLTTLANNPKTKAFIDALEDRPESSIFIEIAGEDDAAFDLIPETQPSANGQESMILPDLDREDTQVDDLEPQVDVQESMQPPTQPIRRSTKKRTPADIRSELSFLRDETDGSQVAEELDQDFVPALKRERSSLSIVDRAQMSRENSQTWRDPRLDSQSESMYSELASVRKVDARDTSGPQTVVVSRGTTHMASRMATKAVNYHARAARGQKEGKQIDKLKTKKTTNKNKVKENESKSKRQDVLKLLA